MHVIMYGYYFGSVYSPTLKTNLTIKRSITQMQIVSLNAISTTGEKNHSTVPFSLLKIVFSLSDPIHDINYSFEFAILCEWVYLSEASADSWHFTECSDDDVIFGFLLQNLHESAETQIQLKKERNGEKIKKWTQKHRWFFGRSKNHWESANRT